MTNAKVGICTIEFYLPGVASLKEKRRVLKSMLAKLHNTFNVSAAEVDYQDKWQSAVVAIAVVSNSTTHANQVIQNTIEWIEAHYPDTIITRQDSEIL